MVELEGYEFEPYDEISWVAYRILEPMQGFEDDDLDRVALRRHWDFMDMIAETRKSCVNKLAKGQMKILLLHWERALEAVKDEAALAEGDDDEERADW